MFQRDPADPFVGRGEQLVTIRACVDDARAGRSRVIWVEGGAGMGKTTLLRHALSELPPDVTVLHAEADEMGGGTPFALIGQLADNLPSEPFAAGLALLRSVADRQGDGPAIVVVEDLHWADTASQAALLTTARRLSHDRIAFLVTSRPDPGRPEGWDRLVSDPRCRRVLVGALDPVDVMDLAGQTGITLTLPEAHRLHAHTAGHPLWVSVLLSELTLAQLQAAEDLPAPRSLAATTVARLANLPPEARQVASALAVLAGSATLPLLAQVAAVPDPAPACQALLASGLVSWSPEKAVLAAHFTHPLYRAAIYADLSLTRRMQLHGAAAAALGPGPGLAHRVAAASKADPILARDLADAARHHALSGAPGTAATYLLWAHDLCDQPAAAEQHLLGAVRHLLADGQLTRAADLHPQVQNAAPTALRSLVLGALAWEQGKAGAAERWWQDTLANTTATQDGDDDTAFDASIRLGSLYVTQGRGQAAVDIAQRTLDRPNIPAAAARDAWMTLAAGQGFLAGATAGLRSLSGRLPQPPEAVEPADADLLIFRGALGFYAGHTVTAVADLRTAIRLARSGAPTKEVLRAHIQLAQLMLLTGAWDEAFSQARVALSLVQGDRNVWMRAQANAVLARLHAGRGQWRQAREHLDQARTAAAALGTAEAVFTARIAAATLGRAEGTSADIVNALADLVSPIASRPLPMLTSLNWWPMLITAFIDVGELPTAIDHLGRMREAAAARGLRMDTQLTGLQAQVLAAQGDPDAAADHYRRAVADLSDNDPILDRIELHHRLGRLLTGRGHRKEGQIQLRHALELADHCGASPFGDRIGADLRTNQKRNKATATAIGRQLRLTDREQDVITLVNLGMTNREVAAELYVSVKAVEYHLGNIYGKLGITSRRQLRTHLIGEQNAGVR